DPASAVRTTAESTHPRRREIEASRGHIDDGRAGDPGGRPSLILEVELRERRTLLADGERRLTSPHRGRARRHRRPARERPHNQPRRVTHHPRLALEGYSDFCLHPPRTSPRLPRIQQRFTTRAMAFPLHSGRPFTDPLPRGFHVQTA